jgi:hypothetical protein
LGGGVDGRDEMLAAFAFGDIGERAEVHTLHRRAVVEVLRIHDHAPAGVDEAPQLADLLLAAGQQEIEDHHIGLAALTGPDV